MDTELEIVVEGAVEVVMDGVLDGVFDGLVDGLERALERGVGIIWFDSGIGVILMGTCLANFSWSREGRMTDFLAGAELDCNIWVGADFGGADDEVTLGCMILVAVTLDEGLVFVLEVE